MLSFLFDYWHWILIGGLAVAGLSAFAYVQRNWHFLVAALTIIGAMGSIAKAFNDGSKAEKEKQKKVQEKVVTEIKEVQRKVEEMPKSQVNKELEKWLAD